MLWVRIPRVPPRLSSPIGRGTGLRNQAVWVRIPRELRSTRVPMFQGGDRSLQDWCGGFDSHGIHGGMAEYLGSGLQPRARR